MSALVFVYILFALGISITVWGTKRGIITFWGSMDWNLCEFEVGMVLEK